MGGGGEARIVFEGADIRDLLAVSRMVEQAMFQHEFGVSIPIITRREFIGEGAETLNILLGQIDMFRHALSGTDDQLEGGVMARGFGAIEVGEIIGKLLQESL